MDTEHRSMDSNLMPKDLLIAALGVPNEISELQVWLPILDTFRTFASELAV